MAIRRRPPVYGDAPEGRDPRAIITGPERDNPTRTPNPAPWQGPGFDPEVGGIPGRSGESPRERMPDPEVGPPDVGRRGPQPTPGRPRVPTPEGGAPAPVPPPGVTPFDPLPGPPADSLTKPLGGGGLFGALGGLKGGGLGVPLDPTSNQASDPIQTLMMLLNGNKGRF